MTRPLPTPWLPSRGPMLSPTGKLDRETTDVLNQRWENILDSDAQLQKAVEVLSQLIQGN